jgi:hypothetical protein
LRERQLSELIELQRRQLAMLEDLTRGGRGPAARLQSDGE